MSNATSALAGARATVVFMSNAGGALAGVTARVPALAVALYLRATGAPATLAPRMAQAVFGAEYAVAARFIALTGSVSANYLALVEGAGRLAYTGTAGTLALVDSITVKVRPSQVSAMPQGAYLGALGEAGLSTYETISGFIHSTTSALASLFFGSKVTRSAPPPTMPPTMPPPLPPTIVMPSVPSHRNLPPSPAIPNSYPALTTVVQASPSGSVALGGVSPNFMNQSLASLRLDILSTVAGMFQPISTQTALNVVNHYSDVQGGGVYNRGTFDSGIVSNAVSVSATTGTFGSLTSSSLNASVASIATTTITSQLVISGNVGIGTTSPSDTLALNGAMYFAPISAPANSAHRLYNVANDLYWAGNVIGGAATGQWTTDGTHVWRPGGFVGIGTTSPSTKLSVGGAAGDTSGHGYFTGGLGVGVLNTVAGTLQTSGAATFGGSLTVNGLCVTADTKLRRRRRRRDGSTSLTTGDPYDYDEVDIVDVKSGDEIQSLDEKTGKLVWSRVKQLAYMGVKQTYKLTTASGKTIRTTANHPYLTDRGWKKVAELKEGMEIAVTGNETAALADGDFVYEDSISNRTGFVIRGTSIANDTSTSSASNDLVDNLTKPAEGIEPSESGMTNPIPHQAAGVRRVYHETIAWERIMSVEAVALEDVYDIEVEGTHNFIGNGIVAHNTAVFNQASSTMFTNSGATWLTGLSASSLLATDANKLLVSTTSIGVSNLALPKGNFIVGSDAGVAQATSSIFISSTGNVGIGTTTPAQLLSVQGNGYFSGTGFFGGAITGTSTLSIQSTTATSTFSTGGLTVGTSQFVVQQTSGNVGIGTTTPGAKLDVYGVAWARTIDAGAALHENLRLGQMTDGYTSPLYTISTGDFADQFTLASQRFNSVVTFDRSSGSGQHVFAKLNGNNGAASSFTLNHGDSSTDTRVFLTTSGSSYLNGGNVGIGTTNPQTKLDVQGTASSTTFYANAGTESVPSYSFSSSPSGGMLLYDANTIGLRASGATGLNVGQGFTRLSTGNVLQWGTDFNNKDIGLSRGAAGKLYVGNGTGSDYTGTLIAGNVGIGTTSPWGLLSVNPNALASGVPEFVIGSSSATHLIVQQNGNVGIGTTVPGAKLQVAGNMFMSNTDFGGMSTKAVTLRVDQGYDAFRFGHPGVWSMDFNAFDGTAATSRLDISDSTSGSQVPLVSFKINGNVGIGTTNPSSLLNIVGNGASNTLGHIQITNNGGTANTGFSFDAGASSNAFSYMDADTSVKHSALFFRDRTDAANSFAEIATGRTSSPALTGMARNDFAIWNATSGKNLYFGTNDGTGAAIKMTVLSTGNVGIGTTSPATTLSVQGNGYFSGTGFFGGAITGTSTLNITGLTTLGFASTTQIGSTGSAYFATASGNVGIGTTGPLSALHIGGSGAIANGLTFGDGTHGLFVDGTGRLKLYQAGAIRFEINGDIFSGNVVGGGAIGNSASSLTNPTIIPYRTDTNTGLGGDGSDALSLITNGTSRVYIKSDGNVGIGTTSPAYKLQISVPDTSTVGLSITSPTAQSTLTTHQLTVGSNYGLTNGGAFTASAGNFTVSSAAGALIFSPTGTELMRMTGGNVGIGTTSPYSKLSVWGADTGANIMANFVNSASTSVMSILNNGNVGIGTASPGHKLDVAGIIYSSKAKSDTPLGGEFMGSNGYWTLRTDNSNKFNLDVYNGGSPIAAMTVLNTGNIGIGTTSPTASLEIYKDIGDNAAMLNLYHSGNDKYQFVGNDTTNYMELKTTNANAIMVWNRSGNVGIGTTGPAYKLDVTEIGNSSGDFKIQPDVQGNVVMFGDTQVADDADGKSFKIYRKAAEGDAYFDMHVSQYNSFLFTVTGGTLGIDSGTSNTRLQYSAAGGNITLFDGAGSGKNPSMLVYGYPTGASASDYASLQIVGANNNLQIQTHNANGNILLNPTSGNVGIGTTNPSTFKLQVAGNVGPNVTNTSNLGSAGLAWECLYYDSGTLGTCASDQSLKENISALDFPDALTQLAGLELHTYSFRSDTSHAPYNGLIAQETEIVAPELVVTNPDTGLKAVKYGDIQWLILSAVQQLYGLVQGLTASVAELVTHDKQHEEEIKALHARVDALWAEIHGRVGEAAPIIITDTHPPAPLEEATSSDTITEPDPVPDTTEILPDEAPAETPIAPETP